VGAFDRAMNRIYEIPEGRPFWKLRPLMIIITLAAVILAGLVAIGLVVSGPVARAIGDTIRLGETAVTVWGIVKWPVLLGLAAVVVAILYYATPNVQQPKFRWISLGAVVAIITWVLASALFGLYVSPRAAGPGPPRREGVPEMPLSRDEQRLLDGIERRCGGIRRSRHGWTSPALTGDARPASPTAVCGWG
jgi:hypothetical protein